MKVLFFHLYVVSTHQHLFQTLFAVPSFEKQVMLLTLDLCLGKNLTLCSRSAS